MVGFCLKGFLCAKHPRLILLWSEAGRLNLRACHLNAERRKDLTMPRFQHRRSRNLLRPRTDGDAASHRSGRCEAGVSLIGALRECEGFDAVHDARKKRSFYFTVQQSAQIDQEERRKSLILFHACLELHLHSTSQTRLTQPFWFSHPLAERQLREFGVLVSKDIPQE
jgi:hypothetical protein